MNDKISKDRIRELFNYDAENGVLSRKIDCGKGIAGQVLISMSLKVDGVYIMTTHIMWLLHHGDWPPNGYWIDHINRIKADNRMLNFRLATPTQNQQNKAGCGTYPKGVTWRDRKEKPWQAKIRVNGVRIHLGSFADIEEATEAYRQAAIKYHGEFACLE